MAPAAEDELNATAILKLFCDNNTSPCTSSECFENSSKLCFEFNAATGDHHYPYILLALFSSIAVGAYVRFGMAGCVLFLVATFRRLVAALSAAWQSKRI